MADNGDDFDEDGIFREPYQDDDFLDEDGIWREDDEKENFDRYTFRTDSGIGTTGRRSTISSVNKLPLDTGRHGGSINLNDIDDSFEDHHQDSFGFGEKSFNISDLEASASVVDDLDFEGASFDSNQDGRVSRSRRKLSQNRHEESIYENALDDTEDFEGSISGHSSGEFDSPSVPSSKKGQSKESLKHDYKTNTYEEPYRSRNQGYDEGVSSSRHFSDWGARDLRPVEQRYTSQPRNSQSLADYLLSGGEHISSRSTTNQSGSQFDERGQQIFGRPRVVGDSIFTQEEEDEEKVGKGEEVLSFHQQRSLMEFERLEAALDFDVKSEKSNDQMDLIGAYLQGLKEQEDNEQDMGTREFAEAEVLTGRRSRDVSRSASVEGTNLQAEQKSKRNLDNTYEQALFAKSSEDRRKEFQSSKNVQRSFGSDHSTKQYSRDSQAFPTQRTGNEFSENWNSSLAYDENVSLLENQQPPFDSMSFSTLDMTGGTNESPSRNATLSEANNSSKASKIPMLRSRSPSMSRPSSPSRGRTQSPGSPQRRSQERGRTLPPTPKQSPRRRSPGSPHGQNSKMAKYHCSNDSDIDLRDAERDLAEEKKLDEAANILLDGNEEVEDNARTTRKDSVSSTIRRNSTSASTDQRTGRSGSRPGSAKMNSEPKKSLSRIRASSEEALKVPNKKDNKMQRSGSGTIPKPQPMKARPGSARTVAEVPDQRVQNEETLVQLQDDYNKLLQKYAQAENTIDSLRIGATIPINVELTTTGGNSNLPNGVSAGTATASIQSGGSLGGSSHKPPIGPGSRPGSARSHRVGTPTKASPRTGLQDPSLKIDNLSPSLSGEGEKLSLLAKAKAVDEKIIALSILLNENCLSAEDQAQALDNIKESYEKLQQETRDAKANHDFLIRTGSLPPNEPEFDEEKVVEGEIYKLGMKIDDVEQQVQENVKHKSSSRIPFKADHSIDVNAMNNGKDHKGERAELPPNRPPSVGSFAGGPEGIDEQVHRLNKEYDNLMDRYRRLKQMRRTPERDQEIDGLLKNLKGIYELTPDHRKPALPPELEVNYNPVNDHFMSFESMPTRRESVNSSIHGKSQESESLPGLSESDLATARQIQDQRRPSSRSGGYTSSATDSTARHRPKKLPNAQGSLTESYDSMSSSQSRRSGIDERPRQYPGFPPPGKARTREDKDSGYVGSEASRKVSPQVRDNRRTGPGPSSRSRSGTRNSSHMEEGDNSNVSESTSDLSTVEYVRPYGSRTNQQRKKPNSSQKEPEPTRTATTVRHYGPLTGKNSSKGRDQRRNRSIDDSATESDTDSDTDDDSQVSGYTAKSNGSSKKDQIQSLTDEINKLRAEIRHKEQRPPVANTSVGPQQTTQQPVVKAQRQLPANPQPQYAYVYGYPMANPAHNTTAAVQTQAPPPQSGVPLPQQPMVVQREQVLVPGMSVGPVVSPEYYSNVAPTTRYRESNNVPPMERWEAYEPHPEDFTDHRRQDYQDRPRRSHHRRDPGTQRDSSRDKMRRMRNYYVPNKADENMNANDRYELRNGTGYNNTYTRPCENCNGGLNYVSAPSQGTYVGGVPPPPSYQQVRREFCKWCHDTGKCEHPALANGGPQPASYVMVPTAQAAHVIAGNLQPQGVLAPLELANVEAKPKVRYYVREFDGHPGYGSLMTSKQRSVSVGNLYDSRRYKSAYVDNGASSESEGGHSDLNSSLNSALRTAVQLKKMSRRMKRSIRSELRLAPS